MPAATADASTNEGRIRHVFTEQVYPPKRTERTKVGIDSTSSTGEDMPKRAHRDRRTN